MSDQASLIAETPVNHRKPIIVSSLIIVCSIVFGTLLTMLRNNSASLETYVQTPTQNIRVSPKPESKNCEPIRAILTSTKTYGDFLQCRVEYQGKIRIKVDPQCNDVNNLTKSIIALMTKNHCSSQVPTTSSVPYPTAIPTQTSLPTVTSVPQPSFLPSPVPTLMPISYADEGEACYGYAGTPCAPGLICGPRPDGQTGPDAGGICTKPNQIHPLSSSGPLY